MRQLKIVIVALVLSNIAVGAFSFYFLRAVDRKYSDLIDQAVPILNDMHTLTALRTEAMRSTSPTLVGDSPQSRAEALERARAAIGRERDLRDGILRRVWLSGQNEERMEFENTGKSFTRAAAEVIGLLESWKDAEANQRREESLRPAFEHYIAATKKAADVLGAQSMRASDEYSERTVSISKMMLGLGSWPVLIMGIFLLITAVFVIAVLLKVFVFSEESI